MPISQYVAECNNLLHNVNSSNTSIQEIIKPDQTKSGISAYNQLSSKFSWTTTDNKSNRESMQPNSFLQNRRQNGDPISIFSERSNSDSEGIIHIFFYLGSPNASEYTMFNVFYTFLFV